MSAAPSSAERRDSVAATPLVSALFLAFALLGVLRVALNNRILDLFMDYTAEGGSIVEKIHPTIWGLCGLALLVCLSTRIELTRWELGVTRAILGVGAIASAFLVLGAVRGEGSSLGYLLDTYVSLITLIALFAFPPRWRRQLGMVLLAYMIASAVIGILEYVFHFRVMPFTEGEAVFRPTGLTNHPLELGQWCTLALCVVAGLTWPPAARVCVGAVLLVGCILSGARMATMVAVLSSVLIVMAQVGTGLGREHRARWRLITLLVLLLAGPLLVAALVAAGALTRFDGSLADPNAMSRVDVYGVLNLLSWKDLLFGGDIESVRKLIEENYHLASIESSLLVFVVQFGLVGALLFLAVLGRLAQTIARGAGLPLAVAILSFCVIALSNNSLSVKSSSVFLIVVLGIAFHDDGHVRVGAWR